MKLKKIEKDDTKKINKKKLVILVLLLVLLLAIIATFMTYTMNEKFRIFCDSHIFSKNVKEDSLPSIKIEDINNTKIFADTNYINVMNNNTITKYNFNGKKESDLSVEVTTPLISTNEDYSVIAEKSGSKIYLISKSGIVWQKEVEGKISRVKVNENGYVSIILSGTSYKSVIVLYDETGKEIFKTYLSTTVAVDTDVSADNKCLAFAEVNMSGTLIQSNIKIVNIEKAKEDPANSIVYTYKADANNLIIDINYQNTNKLICKYNDSIHVIENMEDKKIIEISDKNQKETFCDIGLSSFICNVSEESDGLFNTKTIAELINSSGQKKSSYSLKGTVKSILCAGNKIGLNLGSEVDFIDTNGWLVKKYTANQGIKEIVMSNNIAGIVCKDKIEIINL